MFDEESINRTDNLSHRFDKIEEKRNNVFMVLVGVLYFVKNVDAPDLAQFISYDFCTKWNPLCVCLMTDAAWWKIAKSKLINYYHETIKSN